MATLKLNKKPARPGDRSKPGEERRAPLRGKGVSRPRQTLAEAQAERRERQAAFEQRQQQDGPRGERPARAGSRPDATSRSRSDAGRDEHRGAPRQVGFQREQPRDEGPRFEERRPPRRTEGGPVPRDDHRGRDDRFGREERGEQPGRGRGGFSGPRSESLGPGSRPVPRQDQRRASGPRPDGESRPYPVAQARPPAKPARPASRPHDDEDDDDEDFRDPSAEGERLSKRMGQLGMASRREADEWIAAGWVKVDGKLAVLGQRVGPEARIEVDQLAHKQQAKQATILLHKPIGYVSGQAEDGYEPASVLVRSANHWSEDTSGIKYHIGHSRGLAPAGRLDIDSTGLLVLTQDGRIAKLLIGEDSQIEKEYLVRVEYHGQGAPMKDFPAQDLALLNHGLELDGVQLKPAKVSWINDDQLRFVLREGRKRQIRRMCEQVGLKVVGLKRVRIGRINLGNLPVGQWRFLTPWERFD